MLIVDCIIYFLSSKMLRKYGRISSDSTLSTLFTIIEIKKLKNSSSLTDQDRKYVKLYYFFMTWGFILVCIMVVLVFIFCYIEEKRGY